MRTTTLILALALGACGHDPEGNEGQDPDTTPTQDVPKLSIAWNIPPSAEVTAFVASSRPWVHAEAGCSLHIVGEEVDYVIQTEAMAFILARRGEAPLPVTATTPMEWAHIDGDSFKIKNDTDDFISIRVWDKATDQPAVVEGDACPAL